MNTKTTPFPRRSFIAGAAALGVVALINPSKAFAEDAASVQAEADSAAASLKSMQSNLDKASNDYTQALMDQQQAQDNMDAAQQQIDQQSQQIADLQSKLGTRARSMYRSGSNTFIDVLLGSTTFEAFTSNWDILNNMNDQDAQMVDQTKTAREQLEDAKQEYTQQEQVAAQKAQDAGQIKAQAETVVAQQQAVYSNLSTQAAQLLQQQREAEEAAAAAQAAAVVAASAAGGSDSPSTGGGYEDSDGGSSGSGFDASPYNGNVAATVVAAAESREGCPYVWAAKGPDSFDCSGLVAWCYAQAGVYVPSYTGGLISLPQVSNPQPGDIAVIHGDENHQHTGIYIGGGQMIHAPQTGDVVKVGSVQSGMIIVRPRY